MITDQIKLEWEVVIKENFYLRCLKFCKSNLFTNFIVFQIKKNIFEFFHMKRKSIFIFENCC